MRVKYRPILMNETALIRFWGKVNKTEFCWNWIGANTGGYGMFAPNGRKTKAIRAPRFSWFIHHGDPKQKHVLHRCDNPACIRPDHLFLGSWLQNMRDRRAKNRHPNPLKMRCPAGHEYTDANTYTDKQKRRHCRTCINSRTREYRRG